MEAGYERFCSYLHRISKLDNIKVNFDVRKKNKCKFYMALCNRLNDLEKFYTFWSLILQPFLTLHLSRIFPSLLIFYPRKMVFIIIMRITRRAFQMTIWVTIGIFGEGIPSSDWLHLRPGENFNAAAVTYSASFVILVRKIDRFSQMS